MKVMWGDTEIEPISLINIEYERDYSDIDMPDLGSLETKTITVKLKSTFWSSRYIADRTSNKRLARLLKKRSDKDWKYKMSILLPDYYGSAK
jgi:hypothetical protein